MVNLTCALELGSCKAHHNSHGKGDFFFILMLVGAGDGLDMKLTGQRKSMCINLGAYWILSLC